RFTGPPSVPAMKKRSPRSPRPERAPVGSTIGLPPLGYDSAHCHHRSPQAACDTPATGVFGASTPPPAAPVTDTTTVTTVNTTTRRKSPNFIGPRFEEVNRTSSDHARAADVP